jgi:hypothetical protein
MICRGMKTEVKSELEVQAVHLGNGHTPKRSDNVQAIVK